ncbi:hypothetical protein A2U01_0112959, partial [Trifolium medium]|nr:hypothetical protein [Trifolium medium]
QNTVRAAGCDEDDVADDFVTRNFDLGANVYPTFFTHCAS